MRASIKPKKKLKDAAVIVPVYLNRKGEVIIVMVRRTIGGIHSGQLAFPGGGKKKNDKTLLETALRESEEEIGLIPERVKILENLETVIVQATGYRIYPFLAQILPPAKWNRQEDEIAEILEVKLNDFTRPDIHGIDFHKVKEWPEPRLISFYRIGKYRLWGATYRILQPIIPRLLDGEWELQDMLEA